MYEHNEKLRKEIAKGIYDFDYREFNEMKVKNIGILPTMVKLINGKPKILHNQYLRELKDIKELKIFNSKFRSNDEDIDNSNGIPFVLSGINGRKSPIEIDFENYKDEFLRKVK